MIIQYVVFSFSSRDPFVAVRVLLIVTLIVMLTVVTDPSTDCIVLYVMCVSWDTAVLWFVACGVFLGAV